MRTIDGKFSMDGDDIYNTASNERIPENEPLFLLRARDVLALPTLCNYLEASLHEECTPIQIVAVANALLRFAAFQKEHPDRMKQPGSSMDVKL